MLENLATTKKIAGVVGACAILLSAAACTKQVSGTATAASHEETTTSEAPPSSSGKSSGKSSSEESSSESSSGGGSGTAVPAPDTPYDYKDGTTVKLDAAIEDNGNPDLLSTEVGRKLPFHIDNKSKYELDLSSTALLADVDCGGSSQYVFPSKPIVGPEKLAPGQKGDYELTMGLKKADVGKTCTITIPFRAYEPGGTTEVEVDIATFEMML